MQLKNLGRKDGRKGGRKERREEGWKEENSFFTFSGLPDSFALSNIMTVH